MLNALTIVRFLGAKWTLTNRCLQILIYETRPSPSTASPKDAKGANLSKLAFFEHLSNSNIVVCKGRQGLSLVDPKDAKDAKNAKGRGQLLRPLAFLPL